MRNRILTKESVLDAAEKIIVAEGMKQCSMRRISSALGVAVGTIYNYYESREELLVDLFTISWGKSVMKARRVVNPAIGRHIQLNQFFDVINEDVANRHGLGKEIFIFNNYVKDINENTLSIRRELRAIVDEILNQKEGHEVSNSILSRWIMTVFVDSLIDDRVMTDAEMSMLSQIIDVEFII